MPLVNIRVKKLKGSNYNLVCPIHITFTIMPTEFIFSLYIHYTIKKRQDQSSLNFYTNSDNYLVDLGLVRSYASLILPK